MSDYPLIEQQINLTLNRQLETARQQYRLGKGETRKGQRGKIRTVLTRLHEALPTEIGFKLSIVKSHPVPLPIFFRSNI